MQHASQKQSSPVHVIIGRRAVPLDGARIPIKPEVNEAERELVRVATRAETELGLAIERRIESRLRGRVRNLSVRVTDGIVTLQGQCATYYTKQLAQHAALAILEDEHLENLIVVEVTR